MKCARFEQLLRVAESHVPVGRLLDVGSGLGELLRVAALRGWDSVGLERNAFAVRAANELLPGASVCADISDAHLPAESFDLITCVDVLEHLRRPDRSLAKFLGALKRGGLLLVTTVDASCVPARVLGHRWPHYHRDHLWYFTHRALTELVESLGFDVLACSRARKIFHLRYILEILSHGTNFPLARWLARRGLQILPRWCLDRLFAIREGIVLIATRPIG